MILKIKNTDSTWDYFEGDNIQQDGYFHDKIPEHKSDMLYRISDKSEFEGTIVLCIQKENKVIARVHTNMPTYLLNDNGKTIDKLI
jgi:hypothetical protein